ncbi:MAG: MFS transporter, partial [Dehalococcoidales bacterium]|nr:MFS transporter [Dehalococcoidales bacterium]
LGRRRLLLGTLAIGGLLYLCLAFLVGIEAPVLSIAAIYIVSRSVMTMLWPSVSALITDLTPKERLTGAYGLLRVGGNVGWAAGPALGGYLATVVPYGYLFGLAVVTSTLAMITAFFFLKETSHHNTDQLTYNSIMLLLNDRCFVLFTALCLLIFSVAGQLTSTLSVFTVDIIRLSTAQYGMLLTLNGLLVVFFQYPVTAGIERIGKYRAIIWGCLLYGIGYLALGWVGAFSWALAAMVVITAGEILFSPTTLAIVGELSPREKRGQYMGFFGLSQTLGVSLGPLAGGILLDVFPADPRFVWAPMGITAFAAAIGFHYWYRTR